MSRTRPLFRLPPQFPADLERLDSFLAALSRQRYVPGLRAALEVRHESWLADDVVDWLRASGAPTQAGSRVNP